MKPITNLSTIAANYDALLLDLWGVIHDGSHLYPGVKETLISLRQSGKKIIFISNAPRRAAKAINVLTELGVQPDWYDHLITSGEMGYQWLATSASPAKRGRAGEGAWGKRYYYVGPPKDADILNGLDYQRVDDIKTSDFLLNVGFGSEEQGDYDWQMLFRPAAKLQLPMLCLNPDFEVVKINGQRFPCAGVLAQDYERVGGNITYYGKPYPDIYDYCMNWLTPIEKSRVLAIGDGIATDIKGAVQFGLDSVLVLGGILKNQSESVEAIGLRYKALPNYTIPAFTW